MTIVMHVTTLNEDKSLGVTDNRVLISQNINKVKIAGIGTGNEITAMFFKAGRYIAVVATDVKGKATMSFMDLKNDEHFAQYVGDNFEEDLKRIFMKSFYELSKTYQRDYDLVKLELVDSNSFVAFAN